MAEYFNKLKQAINQPRTAQQFGIVEDIKEYSSIIAKVRNLEAQINELVKWKNSDAIPTMKKNLNEITNIHNDIKNNIVPSVQKSVDAVNRALTIVTDAQNKAVAASNLAQNNLTEIKTITNNLSTTVIPNIQNNIKAIENFPNLVKTEVDKVNITIETIVNNKISEFKVIIENFVGAQVKDAKITLEGFILEQIKQTKTILENYVLNQIKEVKNTIKTEVASAIDIAINTAKSEIGNWVYSFVGNPSIPLCDNDEKTIMGILCTVQKAVEKGFIDAKTVFEKFQLASAQLAVDTKAISTASIELIDSMGIEITAIRDGFVKFGTDISNSAKVVVGNMKYLKNEFVEAKNQIQYPLSIVNTYAKRCKNDALIFLPHNIFMTIYWGFLRL